MRIRGAKAMEDEAAAFIGTLEPREGGATIVALEGDLGAGKTAFAKGAAKALGIRENVTSPTFVIMKIYSLERQKFERLVHIDAYRLKGKHHLNVLGWDEIIAEPKNLVLVEWPQMAGEAIPPGTRRIRFEHAGEDERDVIYL